MKTSKRQTLESGEARLTFSQEDFHANHSVQQVSEKARQMTAISGRKCLGQLRRSDPLGLLVRMLLDSITFPRWRTESVKAYGNAIVPEVARRIFECIDQLSED